MPDRKTLARARADKRAGKSPSTQAGEFVREEIEDIRAGKHGARSAKQAIAIGLSKARRAGVELKPPAPGKTSANVRRHAARDYARGHGAPALKKSSAKRARASAAALKRESNTSASLAAQARTAAARRSPAARSASARRAVRTKGASGRAAAGRKAARTRAARR